MAKTPAKKTAAKTARPIAVDDKRWEAREALHTLKRAHEIKNDPHLMNRVREHAREERQALSKVIGRGGSKA